VANKDFYAGIITALALLDLHGQETIYRELVEMCDKKALVRHAIADGEVEYSCLAKYGYTQHNLDQTAGGRGSKKSKLVVSAAGKTNR